MLVLARLGENTRLVGGLLETAQRALDRLAWCDANFHSYDPPFNALVERKILAPMGPDSD